MSFLPVIRKSVRCALAALYFIGQTLIAGHFHRSQARAVSVLTVRGGDAYSLAALDRDCPICALVAHSRAASVPASPCPPAFFRVALVTLPPAGVVRDSCIQAASARAPPPPHLAVSTVA